MAQANILIVDDNASLAETVAELLAEHGFAVRVATSGAEALVASRLCPVDAVVVDVDLPDIGGLKLARRLARRHRGTAIVVMSAREPQRLVPRCEEMGARFVAKPFSPRRLVATVRAVVEQRQLEAPRRHRSRLPRLLGPRRPRALLQGALPSRWRR
ncbi:MAG: response regulator transcription factor [Candidatus Brocadiia bacterium]